MTNDKEIDLQLAVLNNIKINGNLLPLQFAICAKLQRNNFCFVFDEVGCGKTIEAGICIWNAIKDGSKNILIVSPSNLTFNWYNELLSKFGLNFRIITGTNNSIDLYRGKSTLDEDVSNFCIVSYDSRATENSSAALGRLPKGTDACKWDLIVLDEGHESKNEDTQRYSILSTFMTNQVLFLSATPIRNLQKDLKSEIALVQQMLRLSQLEFKIGNVNPIAAMTFDLNYPLSRNFKEIVLGLGAFKERVVNEIKYTVKGDKVSTLVTYQSQIDQKRGCIPLFLDRISADSIYKYVQSHYRKFKFTKEDYNELKEFDEKYVQLENTLENIIKDNNDERVVIFCTHKAVVDYLGKMLGCKYGADRIEAMHGDTYKQDVRKNRILLLDKEDSEMNKKRVVILSHRIGSVGINLSKFSHLINYELPYTPADLEQRFGRIDRITNPCAKLNLYFFKDTNGILDTVYLNRILFKLQTEVLPFLPSKNLLETTPTFIDDYVKLTIKVQEVLKYLEENLLDSAETNEEIMELCGLDKQTTTVPKSQDKIKTQCNDFLTKLGCDTATEEDEISERMNELFNKNYSNEVTYYDVEEHSVKSLSFTEVKACTEDNSYKAFSVCTRKLNNQINDTIEAICACYTENENDLAKFIKSLRVLIDEQCINENMLFSTLYGCHRAIATCDPEITFLDFMQEYNKKENTND